MHQSRKSGRGRVFYIFHRFIRELRSEMSESLIPSLLGSIEDLLALEIELPAPDSEDLSSSSAGSSPNPDQDANSILEDAVRTSTLFDSQLWLFETTGTLISALVGANEGQQLSLLQVRPSAPTLRFGILTHKGFTPGCHKPFAEPVVRKPTNSYEGLQRCLASLPSARTNSNHGLCR